MEDKRDFNRSRPANRDGRPSFNKFGDRPQPRGDRSFGGDRSQPRGDRGPRSFGDKPRGERSFGGDRPSRFGRPAYGESFSRDRSSRPSRDEKPSFSRDRVEPRDIKIVSLELINEGIAPKYMTSGASGMDVYSNMDITIEGGQLVHITTGVIMKSLPPRMIFSVRGRSSLSQKGLLLLSPTLITKENVDKELIITCFNVTKEPIIIAKHDRVCQITFAMSEKVNMEIADKLEQTERNEKGFGSTDSESEIVNKED